MEDPINSEITRKGRYDPETNLLAIIQRAPAIPQWLILSDRRIIRC